MGARLQYFHLYYHLVGCNILAVAYRGYGKSTGIPNESGIKLDALAIMKYAFNHKRSIDNSKIFLHGRSLGGLNLSFQLILLGAVATYA